MPAFKLFTPAYGPDRRPFFYVPTHGGGRLKIFDIKDERIEEARLEWEDAGTDAETQRMLGFVPRDDDGNYAAPSAAEMSTLSTREKKYQSRIEKLNAGTVQSVTVNPNDISREALSKMLRDMPRDRMYVVNQDDTYYTLTDEVRNEIVHHLEAHQDIYQKGSGRWMYMRMTGGTNFSISQHDADTTYEKKSGAFFNHLLRSDLSDDFAALFDEIQIWKKLPDTTAYCSEIGANPKWGKQDNHYSCLIAALMALGCDNAILQEAKCVICGLYVPKSKLYEFSKQSGIRINLHTFRKRGKSHSIDVEKMYDPKDTDGDDFPVFDIGFIDNHYIAMKQTEICRWALRNYDDVKHLPEWWKFTGKGKKNKGRGLRTLEVVHEMLKNDKQWFVDIPNDDAYMATLHFANRKNKDYEGPMSDGNMRGQTDDERKWSIITKHIKTLKTKAAAKMFRDNGFVFNKELKRYERPENCKANPDNFNWSECFHGPKKAMTISWDTETTTDGETHRRYTSNYYNPEIGERPFTTERAMLRELTEECTNRGYSQLRIYAHNATYDMRSDPNGILSCLRDVKLVETSGRIVVMSGTYAHEGKELFVKLVDSQRFVTTRLANFPKMFGLGKIKKEIMPYHIFNERNMFAFADGTKVPASELAKAFPKDEAKQSEFMDNVRTWGCLNADGETVDLRKYSNVYCNADCKILYEGMAKFRSDIFEITGLDIDTLYTAAGIAEAYMFKQGAFDGVREMGGVVRDFHQKCVVGGRVCMSDNEPKTIQHERACDADANSLYPASICRLPGYVKGSAKGITQSMLDDPGLNDALDMFDMYYVRIRITKVGKHYKTPLISYLDDNGIRCWDDTDAVGRAIYVDKIGLTAMRKFHKIEYKVLAGYYYNEGFNTKVHEVIRHLYDARREMKRAGNPIEAQYKLILNSAYGRTLMKARETVDDYVEEARISKYIKHHYNSIRRWFACGHGYYKVVKTQPIDTHTNFAHIGVNVLSESKTIMMEASSLVEDIGGEVWYSDTDSMQMGKRFYEPLCKAYKAKYGKEFEGDDLGQFSEDYEIKTPEGKCTDVYARRCWFLAKKLYTCEVVGTHPTTGEEVVDWHVRGKGFPTSSILHHCDLHGMTPGDLAQSVYEGNEHEIDCLNSGERVSFEFLNERTVRSRLKMMRTMRCARKNESQPEPPDTMCAVA